MRAWLVGDRLQPGLALLHFALLAGVSNAGNRLLMLVGCGLVLALALPASMAAYRRAREIDDTPTSRVASAAQGYVELQGRARGLDGIPVRSPLTGLVCLWYRYAVQRRDGDRWVPDDAGESDDSFILDDGSGQCLVDPAGALMMVARRDRWQQGGRRYTQWSLLDGDPLYALGDFATSGSVELVQRGTDDVKALLAQWKQDPRQLAARFDLDGDGTVDLREWELARRQARREVEKAQREARSQAELHLLRRPRDGRPYIVSSFDPRRLARRFFAWAWLHFAALIAGAAGFAYAWRLV